MFPRETKNVLERYIALIFNKYKFCIALMIWNDYYFNSSGSLKFRFRDDS